MVKKYTKKINQKLNRKRKSKKTMKGGVEPGGTPSVRGSSFKLPTRKGSLGPKSGSKALARSMKKRAFTAENVGRVNPQKASDTVQKAVLIRKEKIANDVIELLKLIDDPDIVRKLTFDPNLIKQESINLKGQARLKALEINKKYTGNIKQYAGSQIQLAAYLDPNIKKKIDKSAAKQAQKAKRNNFKKIKYNSKHKKKTGTGNFKGKVNKSKMKF